MSKDRSRKTSLWDDRSKRKSSLAAMAEAAADEEKSRKLSLLGEKTLQQLAEDRMRRPSLLPPLRKNSSAVDGHGMERGPDLDEEMEKVFAMADEERFDLARISTASPDSTASKKSFNEKDYSMHRKKSYPHMHMPLKSIHTRSMRKRGITSPRESESESAEGYGSPEAPDSRKVSLTGTDSDVALSPSSQQKPNDYAQRFAFPEEEEAQMQDLPRTDSEPQISERAADYDSPTDSSRRVQFQIGETSKMAGEDNENADVNPEEEEERRDSIKDEETLDKRPKRKHSRHHHHHHRRKYSLQEGMLSYTSRLRTGLDNGGTEGRRISIQPEEASTLQEQDIDDLTSHRFDDAKGLRRYKISSSSMIHVGRKDGEDPLQTMLPLQSLKKIIDRSPHEVFVQLDELHGEGEEREWKETARWIKYEEDVEEGADRWGQPHVASLSFHSLLNLRRCLETGVVLLDLEEKDLPGVAYRVVEQMVVDEMIEPEDKPTVMRALLLRHRHVNEHDRFRFGIRRTFSSYTSLQSLADDRKPKIVPSVVSMDVVGSNGKISPLNSRANHSGGENKTENHVLDVKEETTYMSSNEDLKRVAKESILRRIPIGAEATTVLVGAVDFLEQPTIAFVRLAEGIYMPSITEVTIPVRFLFILLGPRQVGLDYHEIGRSISTLMSNTQFHKIAYKAEERKELLSAINEFLDDSIVIPPGDWDKKNLLPFGELKAKSDMIRRRKTTRLMQTDDAQKALLPLGDGGKPPFDDPLRRTRRPFGGLINDLKRRFPFYVSDIKDGCNPQCLAAAIFMYFAALSGAITFGGLMADKTDNLIGISETLIATAASGILFALIAGQPLVIIGSTGPLLLFDESLYSFCVENGIEFLSLRVFIGMWLGIIALFVVCFEGSVLVKLFTRFTEEIFAALISILYIVESIMKLIVVFHKHPLLADYCTGDEFLNGNSTNNDTFNSSFDSVILNGHNDYFNLDENSTLLEMYPGNETDMIKYMPHSQHEHKVNQPNTALFCLILALGTFFIAYYLRHFRNSKFLGRSARRALGDFGVPIAIISMVLLDYMVPQIYTEKLHVPAGLSPSNPEIRGWLIIPVIDSVWLIFAAAAPALLIYILLFMETHICELIINKKERKLKKGSGFHLDIVIVCLANVGCGLMGAPWQCAATVRSIAHVSALTVMSRTHAPGDKPHIIEVKEQRLSALMVSLLVGASVLMAPLLRLVPMSVLFGVFLYMGISSTNGIQFFDRLQLFFMPVKHHPDAAYVKRVHQAKMHLFTFIQLMCLAILWVVKSTEASLAFPFFLILMVPLRRQLRFVFTPAELRALDSEEADEAEDEPDFYEEAPLPG